MKLKFLLLFLLVVGWSALTKAQTLPYNHLLITEMYQGDTYLNYVEFTNMGDETIDLSNFEFGYIGAWTQAWTPDVNNSFRLPKKMLAPGKSFLISTAYDYNPKMFGKDPRHFSERRTKPEFFKIADMLLHEAEAKIQPTKGDSVTLFAGALQGWGGRETYYLRQFFYTKVDETVTRKDSVIVDQIGGVFDESDGTNTGGSYSVAGVTGATADDILIRKNSVKTGVADMDPATNAASAKLQFNATRGLDFADSEWIPVPMLGWDRIWRAVFWTAGNQVNAVLNANTLVSKTGKVNVDLAAGTITVPWGVRNDDSIMYQFVRKPGLAWKYDYHTAVEGTPEYAQAVEDSAYISARTGDLLTLYVCGDQVTTKEFKIIALEATKDDNIVIPKNGFDYNAKPMQYGQYIQPYSGYRVTDGVKTIDSITHIDFATRVDTLLKYLEKPAKASCKIVFKSGITKPDLQTGDILRVTSENGKAKDYFLKLDKFFPSANAQLTSITWPDMPDFYEGDLATLDGWKGDTIPSFSGGSHDYVVKIPAGYEGIPALAYTKEQLNSKVIVDRAKTLDGTVAERTVTWTVIAEDDSTKSVYTVRFSKTKDAENVQPWIAEPFFSQYTFREQWGNDFLEIVNPGTEPLDMSHYMIMSGGGIYADVLGWDNANTTDSWSKRFMKYVPGKQWQNEADWTVKPRILEPDLAVNSYVYPGDVFVLGNMKVDGPWWWDETKHPATKEVDVQFSNRLNHWGLTEQWNRTVLPEWLNATMYLMKITNDSVINGDKAATDINDFELIDVFGGGNWSWVIGGVNADQTRGWVRKPSVFKGNTAYKGSFGTNKDDSEWIMQTPQQYYDLGYGWPNGDVAVSTGIGSHTMDDVNFYKSTVTSTKYKVSPGYGQKETIRGLITGTTVSTFYSNILKATPIETLTVKSRNTGLELTEADAILNGDSLLVLSEDSTNLTKYILDVSAFGLNADARLTSTIYDLQETGSTGTIGGFSATNPTTPLKDIVAGVTVPFGATLTLVDENDAYMTLSKLNFDSLYVDVVATDKIYFEVIAENGINKITYQLKPNTNPSDAFVTSDVYSVAQDIALIDFIPEGCTVGTLINNLTPAPGASITVYDKAGFVRTEGALYRDDKLVVTSADGTATKAYYFSMLNYKANTYLAFVLSDSYIVNQVTRTIMNVFIPTTVADFYTKVTPNLGASMKVIDKDGKVSTQTNLVVGDQLLVTAADGVTTTTYSIDLRTVGISNTVNASIRIYPNPTTDKVIINGLTKGNRVRVINAAGITLRDVTVNISTEYVSLAAQPAGVYVFVISSGDQFINIQKVIKK